MGLTTATPIEILLQLSPIGGAPIRRIAFYCAALSLAASVATALFVALRTPREPVRSGRETRLVTFGHLSALLPGVVAAIIQAVVLSMRVMYVLAELLHGYPAPEPRDFGFGPEGLWSLGLLLASNLMSLVSTRDGRLATCLLWTGVMVALWACLLSPLFATTTTGGFERTAMTLWVLISLSALVTVAAAATAWFEKMSLGRTAHVDLSAPANELRLPPGLATTCSVLAMVIGLLVCHHLLVPIRIIGGGYRGAGLIATGSAALTSFSCLLLLRRAYNGSVADAAIGLATLGFCGAATLFVPSRATVLAERYPMIFNSMIIGLACATALWTWLAEAWRQRPDRDRAGAMAGAMAGRLIPHAKRFAFLSASLALVADILMIFWPRLPGIATMDHSYGRVTAGFAANLFLLLVMLWCSRRLRRLTFHLLTLLAVASTAGFLIMRMIPFASRAG